VKRDLIGRSVRPFFSDRGRHLGNTKNSVIAIIIAVRERHISPQSAPPKQSHTTAKVVWVRNL
jgi:hypothetical protein